jgi:hypothetical protein
MVKKHIYYRKDIKLVVSLGFQRENVFAMLHEIWVADKQNPLSKISGGIGSRKEGRPIFYRGGRNIFRGPK